jgi:Mg2+-importing ATPase
VKPPQAPVADLLDELGTTREGLTDAAAAERLARRGPNALEGPRRHRGLRLLGAQFASPIILILVAATVLSMATGDLVDGGIILAIIAASGTLWFWQEHRAGQAVDALLAQIRVSAEVRRSGRERSVPIDTVVRGDVVVLGAGDLVPGDARILCSRDLLVDEATLTGESYPVEKSAEPVEPTAEPAGRADTVFMGTHVVTGTADVVVTATGSDTEFGALSRQLGERDVTTVFERGINQFGYLLVRVMLVLVTTIFVVNLVLDRPLLDSFLFSLALAVGLTPQLLPAIVAVSLATGARVMAREKVIVRRLDAIEDFGAMTVLCTDKTGTLTAGAIRLDHALDVEGSRSAEVLRLAALNAGLQQGYPNPIDDAVITVTGRPHAVLLDENPYDFTRKRLAVLVGDPGAETLVTKGAFAATVAICDTARTAAGVVAIDTIRSALQRRFESLSADGYRVLAVATRPLPGRRSVTAADETHMTLEGLLAFHDPPKAGVTEAITRLREQGVSVRLVTGDSHLAATQVATAVGLPGTDLLTGADVDALDDDALAARVATASVFAEVEPLHKRRIVAALRSLGETVGFLGDGINDTVALHTADVGISVDTAVDAAKQTAAIVLLDKSLAVVSQGVTLGRRTFANTLKYIRVTTSANFGNVLSMTIAAGFLPFLPLLPRQVLLLNFLSDIPGVTIAEDAVDPEQLEAPRAWHLRSIRNFMITYGAISSAFDLATFVVLRVGYDAGATLFHSAWFVESTLTELAVMLVLRTNRTFFRSRPGRGLLWTSGAVAAVTVALPYSPLAAPLGLTGLPVTILATIVGIIVGYVVANELVKRRVAPQT